MQITSKESLPAPTYKVGQYVQIIYKNSSDKGKIGLITSIEPTEIDGWYNRYYILIHDESGKMETTWRHETSFRALTEKEVENYKVATL